MAQTTHGSFGLGPFAPVLALLSICIVINFINRGSLSSAAPLLKGELGISAAQLGVLLSSFFWTYTAMLFVSGWLVDRFNVNLVIAAGCLVLSVAVVTTGMVRGFVMLLAMQLLLGIGESVAFPSCSKILAQHLPEHRRGFANGVIQSALSCGNMAGILGAGFLMARYGWRPVLIGTGLASLLWIPAWMKWMPRGKTIAWATATAPGSADILRQRSFWGTSVGHFCGSYMAYFMITWLPFYLVHERRLSMPIMAEIATIYYTITALSSAISGWLADLWIRKGGAPTLVRKLTMAFGYTAVAIAMGSFALAGPQCLLVWLMVAGAGCGMAGSGTFTFSQTLAGPQAAGRWTGLQGCCGSLAGVVGPALTGFVVDRTGSFRAPFAITAALQLVGCLGWVFVVKRVEQVSWKQQPRGVSAPAEV